MRTTGSRQIRSVVTHVANQHHGVGTAVLIAAGALVLTVLVRALYVGPLLGVLSWRARHAQKVEGRLQDMQGRMDTPDGRRETYAEVNRRRRHNSERDLDRFAVRVTRVLADIEYFLREPLGWREGTAVIWAGMRGAITVAAAQTLPDDTPQRSVLVLIAFADVAAMSLLIQGGSIGPLLRYIAPEHDDAAARELDVAERDRLFDVLRTSAETVVQPPGLDATVTPDNFNVSKRYRLEVIAAQRSALLDERDNGTFDANVLEHALATLDASQIDIDLRGAPVT